MISKGAKLRHSLAAGGTFVSPYAINFKEHLDVHGKTSFVDVLIKIHGKFETSWFSYTFDLLSHRNNTLNALYCLYLCKVWGFICEMVSFSCTLTITPTQSIAARGSLLIVLTLFALCYWLVPGTHSSVISQAN